MKILKIDLNFQQMNNAFLSDIPLNLVYIQLSSPQILASFKTLHQAVYIAVSRSIGLIKSSELYIIHFKWENYTSF